MDTPVFAEALEELRAGALGAVTAVMCSETLWWRCHRRMIADALLVRGDRPVHLLRGRQEPHRLHPAARAEGTRLIYDRTDEEAADQLPLAP